jgi:hypothetical protein
VVTSILALGFIGEAIGLLLSSSLWLDGVINGSVNSLLVFFLIGKYPSQKKYLWLMLIVAIAALCGILGINSEITRYLQILWSGLSLSFLSNRITRDIENSRGYGRLGAKKLMEDIIKSVPHSSILRRFQTLVEA